MSQANVEQNNIWAQHESIARYRLYLFEPRKKRGKQKTEVERGLTYQDGKQKAEQMNAELKAAGRAGFMDPSYGIELTNAWDTFTDHAKERHIALGKCEADFRL